MCVCACVHVRAVQAFAWNGGGTWAGRPWSPDLPNDSALLLYLFAAYLDAPGWEFSGVRQGEGAHRYRGGVGPGMALHRACWRDAVHADHTDPNAA